MIHNISRFIAALALLATAQGAWATNKTLSGSENYTAQNGDVLTGTTSGTVTIADGANITLSGATITGGIVCEGTATITLDGTNSVNVNNASLAYSKAGIQIGSSRTTLTIRGDGSLTATGGSAAAGIGLGRTWDASVTAGAIVIEGGTVNASGDIGIGIGTVGHSQTASIDGISIKGGTVSASLGKGNIYYGSTATVDYIKIYDTIDMVDASKITETVTYMHVDGETATDVTANKTDYFTIGENGDRRIIVPKDDTDYTITIADGIEHGTLTVAETAKYMETVTVTATPAFGYRFVRLIVKDAQNNDVASTVNTFQMPKGGATVSAVFEQGTHGTTEFAWAYLGPSSFVNEATIYDGVTTVNLQNTEVSYNILKYDENTYSKFLLDNNTYYANIPYAGGTGEFQNGNGTYFNAPYDGQTGYYDITMTDAGNGKWGVSIKKTAAQMDVVPDQTYTGSAITPEPLVIAGSLSLTKGTDYTYSYTNNTNVGTATVRATFQGTYASLGYVEKTFTIAPWSGSGTIGDPYMIYNKDQLLLLAHRVNGTNGETANTYEGMYFKLGADITFSHDAVETDDYAENYEAIGGNIGGTYRFFKGNFDGDGYTVSGIRIRKTGHGTADINQGLFGCIGSGADIHDVHLTDARITGYQSVGGIASYNVDGYIWGCSVTDSYITATNNSNYGTICGRTTNSDRLRKNYYHGCTVNGTPVTSDMGCQGADIADYNGALPAYRLALGANITTPPGTFAGQTGWLDTPPVDARLAPENGFTLAGNHYFASGYVFTPGSTLASGAAQGYTPRATLGDELLDPYTPTGEADALAGTAIAQFTVNADCDGKTLASTLRSTGQPVTVAYVNADGTPGEASAIALDGTETVEGDDFVHLAAGTYYVGTDIAYANAIWSDGDVTLILADGCEMNVVTDDLSYGIVVGGYLEIYGQSEGTGTLSVTTNDTDAKAIRTDGDLVINGGNVTANANGETSQALDVGGGLTINGGNVTANSKDASAIRVYGDIAIAGGTVNATTDGEDVEAFAIRAVDNNVNITGGTVNANASGDGATGIYAGGNIFLYWIKPTDRIRINASSYTAGSIHVGTVVDGKKLHNGSTFLYGTLSDPAAALNGKTLRPAAAATYTTADGTAATADAILLDASDNSLPAGNYLATGTLNYTHGITLNGNVTLILADNCHMNVGTSGERIEDYGFFGFSGGSYNITITSESLGDDMGALSIYTTGMNMYGILANAITIDGGNVTADTNGDYAVALYAGSTNNDVTINGGTVTANTAGTEAHAIFAIGDFNYNGGNVTATAPNANAIYATGGNYTFSWRTPADRITIGATGLYAPEGKNATFARLFTDGTDPAAPDPADNYYGGTYTGDALNALAGKTLSGTTEVTLTEDNATQALAAINGMSGIGVTFNRAFSANVASTICLPFNYTKNEGDGSFYAFTSIEHSGSEYIATMTEPGTTMLTANTPYLYLPSATGNVEFSGTPTTAIAAGTTTSGDWTFQGTYDEVKWDTAPTGIYGFSAQNVSAQDISQSISQGEFVKVGAKVRIRPLRAYLKYKNGTENYSAAPTRGTTATRSDAATRAEADATDLPDRITVRLVGSDGNTTAIGTLDTRTGEVEIDTWYDLNGRRLAAKPTHRGIYINNGRKVVIK